MTAVEIRGLAALRRRLGAAAAPQAIKQTLRGEAEALADEARRAAPGDLGRTVEVRDMSQGTRLAYAVGTPDKTGRLPEQGTVQRPVSPWLWPLFRDRLPQVKHNLGRVVAAALKMQPKIR